MRQALPKPLMMGPLLCLIVACMLVSQSLAFAQTAVDLSSKPKSFARDGALITVMQNAEATGSIISVEYPNGEGGGNVVFKVEPFEGPLGRLTFNAKGNPGNWRIGVRGSSKEASTPSIDFPLVSEVEQAYSVDFAEVIHKAKLAGIELQYPIIEVVIGFRHKADQKNVVEISNLLLHAGE